MASIIEYTEEHDLAAIPKISNLHRTRNGVIARAAMEIGDQLGVKYIAVFTQSGTTARRMARLRPRIPLIVFTPSEDVRQQLALVWGVRTMLSDKVEHTDDMVNQVDVLLRDHDLALDGDRVVIICGMPAGMVGSTNTIRVHKMGETFTRSQLIEHAFMGE